MNELIEYTPSQAIRAVKGLYRRKLYEMIKNGEISCSGSKGQKLINASELGRVFGGDFIPLTHEEALLGTSSEHKERKEQGSDENIGNMMDSIVFQVEKEQLNARISDKERMIALLQEQVGDLQKDRDHWRQQATYLLEDKRDKEAQEEIKPEPKKKKWWFW